MFLLKNSENTQMFWIKISENTKMFVFIETVQLSVQAHQISLLRTPPPKKKEMIYKLSM